MPNDYMDHCFERGRRYDFRKNKETDKVFWLDNGYHIRGELIFSFDKKKCYYIFWDYPNNLTNNLTKEEKEIFDRKNPFWVDFFSD